MKIALMGDEKKKEEMVWFGQGYKGIFEEDELFGRGRRGVGIMEGRGLVVRRYECGGVGGDEEIGSFGIQEVRSEHTVE